MSATVDCLITLSPTLIGFKTLISLPAHILLGKGTGGKNSPNAGCESTPSSSFLTKFHPNIQCNPEVTGSPSLGFPISIFSVALYLCSTIGVT